MNLAFASAALLAWAVAQPASEPNIPPLSARVTDQANLLSQSEAQRLEALLGAYESQTGHQFALLTVPSLEGWPIEEYAIRVAEAWKLGDEKRDDGLIFVVAKQERKTRIEVGYGLEGAIPDVLAFRILDRVVRPAFRKGQYAAGIEAAFAHLMRAAEGEAVALPKADRHSERRRSRPWSALLLPALLAVFFLGSIGTAVMGFALGTMYFGLVGGLLGGV
ncbi:MAG TPA: TPM domain-containing protein, partial [Myxococcales bacterium LLY-WYZ-16_1]|nr:TPM domain-containing protein [Myxococcales bacterium LLY-WYZ-16_1]